MGDKYKKALIILWLLLAVFLLSGCSEEKIEDDGELIRRPLEQIEMYI